MLTTFRWRSQSRGTDASPQRNTLNVRVPEWGHEVGIPTSPLRVRLLHATLSICGKPDFGVRNKLAELSASSPEHHCREQLAPKKLANCRLFAHLREISLNARLRGGGHSLHLKTEIHAISVSYESAAVGARKFTRKSAPDFSGQRQLPVKCAIHSWSTDKLSLKPPCGAHPLIARFVVIFVSW